jgi:hypothetical protein
MADAPPLGATYSRPKGGRVPSPGKHAPALLSTGRALLSYRNAARLFASLQNDGWDASLPPTRRPLRPVECPSSVQRMVTGLTMARIESLDVVPGAGQAPTLARAEDAFRSKPRGSQHGQVSVWIRRFILRLAGYKILVGTGPSSRR